MASTTSEQKRRVIGGKGTSLAYGRAERVFHRSDMPPHAQASREEVLRFRRHGPTHAWTTSTALPGIEYPHKDKLRTQIFKHDPTEYEYNFRAEVLPKGRPAAADLFGRTTAVQLRGSHFKRVQEMSVHPALDEAPPWRSSTLYTHAQHAESYSSLMEAAKRSTMRSTSRLADHVSAVAREAEFMAELRQTRSALAGAVSHAMAASTAASVPHYAQPTQMQVFKRMQASASTPLLGASPPTGSDVHRRTKGQLEDDLGMQHIGRPKRSTSTGRFIKRYFHEGVYGALPMGGAPGAAAEAEPTFGWSCCGSSDPRARGCSVATLNPERYCFDSI